MYKGAWYPEVAKLAPWYLRDTQACSQACDNESLWVESPSTASLLQPGQVTCSETEGHYTAVKKLTVCVSHLLQIGCPTVCRNSCVVGALLGVSRYLIHCLLPSPSGNSGGHSNGDSACLGKNPKSPPNVTLGKTLYLAGCISHLKPVWQLEVASCEIVHKRMLHSEA